MSNSIDTNTLANNYFKYLVKNRNFEINSIFHGDDFFKKMNASILNKVIFRIFPSLFLKPINTGIISQINSFQPDIMFIFKGMEIYPDTLKYAKDRGVKLICYNGDHPYKYISKGSGNSNVLNSIKYYDIYLTYSKLIALDLERKFKIKTVFFPFASYSDKINEVGLVNNEINKACFIGFADESRALFINELVEMGASIDLYGSNWNKFIKQNSRLKIFDTLNGVEYFYKLVQYRVQINIFREHNINSHNMRTFEVPGIGGILLTERTNEQESFFKENEEVFFYDNIKDCKSKIDFLLSLSLDASLKIRRSAIKKCQERGYSYESRSKNLTELLLNLGSINRNYKIEK
jgi:spore maturation protein CgeB